MYTSEVKTQQDRILKKTKRKNRKRFIAAMNKMDEIVLNPHHYKNLRYGLKEFRRAHIDSSFVLLFSIDESKKLVSFEDLQHHDDIYK